MDLKPVILILIDEANLRRSLALVLESAGYRVNSVTRPQEAFQHLQSFKYSLTLLDLKNPDQEYPSVLPTIHQLCPEMPVLILITGAQPGAWAGLIRSEKQAFLNKPVDPQTLLCQVDQILADRGELAKANE